MALGNPNLIHYIGFPAEKMPFQAPHELNLAKAVIVSPANLSKQEKKALTLLVEEVEKRTLVRWDISSSWPAESTAVVAVGSVSRLAEFAGPYAEKLAGGQRSIGVEGYHILVEKAGRPSSAVFVIGN